MRKSLKIKWDNELAIAILFFGPQINYYLALLLSMNGRATLTTPIYAILYIVGACAYIKTLRNKKCFFSFVGIVLALGITVLINSKVTQYMISDNVFASALIVLMLLYFPIYLLILYGIDLIKLVNLARKFSYVTLIVAIITFGNYMFIRKATPPDYMSFAYMMLTPILLCFIFGTEGHIWDLILSAVGGFIIFIVGCRGAVISLAVFFVFFLIAYYIPKSGKKFSFGKMFVIIGIIAVAVFSEQILNYISYGLSAVGFTSRTVNKLIAGSGAFIESEGRQAIWNQAIHNIGLLGKGLFGDRTVIIDEYARSTYAHNFFLEILVDSGWIIGLFVLAGLIGLFIRAFRYSLKSNSSILIKLSFIIISIIFAKHMISASFLTSFDFWFYLGLAAYVVNNKDSIVDSSYPETEPVEIQ